MYEDIISMIVPVSLGCAAVRGLTLDSGYATVEINTERLSGQLSKLVAEFIEDTRRDKITILSGQSMFDEIKKNFQSHLGRISDINEYADKMGDALDSLDRLIGSHPKTVIYSHDVRDYEWRAWDNPSISPEVWLTEECNRMRNQGLVISIAGQELPEGLRYSMGPKLVGIAKKQGLLD